MFKETNVTIISMKVADVVSYLISMKVADVVSYLISMKVADVVSYLITTMPTYVAFCRDCL